MKYPILALVSAAAAAPLNLQTVQQTLNPANLVDQVVGFFPESLTGLRQSVKSDHSIPSLEDAARVARTLVHRESLTTLVTVNKDGLPEGYVEYYADCGSDGNPVMLNVHIGTGFRNIAAGSRATLSVRVGDHPVTENTNPWYPGGIVKSPAGSPRVSLRGQFEDLDKEEIEQVEACFLERHPDAKWWLPGNDVHTTHWVKFNVESLHMVGGFGDRAYIGEIGGEEYRQAEVLGQNEFAEVHGMSKEEMKKVKEKHHGKKKHHGNHGNHGKLTKEQILKIHAALSKDPEKFLKDHSDFSEKSMKEHSAEFSHPVSSDLTEEQLLKIHAALSDDPETFKLNHGLI